MELDDAPPRVQLCDDLLLGLMHYLPSPTLQRYARTNRAMYAHYQKILYVLYDIELCLSTYFPSVAAFRRLQAHTGLLVSGSVALQFLARTYYGTTDLDLYVEILAAYVVLDWLRCHGYGLVSRTDPDGPLNYTFWETDVALLADATGYYLRPGQVLFKLRNAAGLCIDLIVSSGPPVSSLFFFHSSIVMNLISDTCAIAFFPYGSFDLKEMLMMHSEDSDRLADIIKKYEGRGFKVCEEPHTSRAFVPGHRWIADSRYRSDLELVRGPDEDVAVRRRSPWVLPLPPVDLKAEQAEFWSNRSYDLHTYQSASARLGLAYWYRNGWELRILPGGAVIIFDDFLYDTDSPYVVPDGFADYTLGRLHESVRSTALQRGRRLDLWISLFRLHDV